MNHPTLKILGLAAGFALCGGLSAYAQDKATLDLLVKKGTITADEEASIMKNAAVPVTPKEKAVKALKLEGVLQTQFDWLTTDDKQTGATQPGATAELEIRRAYFGAIADLGNGWGGEVLFDFAAGAGTSGAPQAQSTFNNFEKLVVTKKVDDYGTGMAGYTKPNWDQEENTPSASILTVERSITTRYFDEAYNAPTTGRLGFGNHHVGIFWNGMVPGFDGFYYGASITNGIQSTTSFSNPAAGTPVFNEFGFWGNAGYMNKVGNFTYKAGVNVGYTGDANSTPGAAGVPSQNNAIWGYNPYFTVSYDAFTLAGEFLQTQVQNGRVNAAGLTSAAYPYGFNVMPSYKINDQWELVARYSYLSTNGRGTTINPVERNAANPLPLVAGAVNNFDNAYALYGGFNYYIIGNDLKFTAGYEFAQFSNRQIATGGPYTFGRANVSAIEARIQLLF